MESVKTDPVIMIWQEVVLKTMYHKIPPILIHEFARRIEEIEREKARSLLEQARDTLECHDVGFRTIGDINQYLSGGQ